MDTLESDRREARAPGREAWLWATGAWLALRLVASAGAWASVAWIRTGRVLGVPDYVPPHLGNAAARLAGVWLRSDALWYMRVATVGYGPPTGPGVGSYAFLPLFPTVVRLLRPLFGGNELFAALFVSSLACLLGFVFLYRFVAGLLDEDTAKVAVFGLALFPTAFFLVAPYAESLLLAAGAGALLAAQRGRWAVAALAAALAALSRPFGVLLMLPLLGMAWGRGRRPWIAPAGSVAGLTTWLTLAAVGLHDPLGAFHVQSMWQRRPTLPPITLVEWAKDLWSWRGSDYVVYFAIDGLAVVAIVALAVAALKLLHRRNVAMPVTTGLGAYAALTILLPLSNPFPGRPLLSFPRFALALFPAFIACAVVPKRWRVPLALMSAICLAWATAVFIAAGPIY